MNFYQLTVFGPPVCHLSPNDAVPLLRDKRKWPNAWERLAHYADAGPVEGTVDDDGRDWHDILGCGAGQACFVFSERVVAHCRSLSGVHFRPVEIKQCWNKKLQRKERPEYLWSHVTGRVPVRILDSSRQELPRNEETGQYNVRVYPPPIYELKLDPALDFFLMGNVNTGFCFVSERFVKLAEQHRWTNVAFHALTEGNLLDMTIYHPIISFVR